MKLAGELFGIAAQAYGLGHRAGEGVHKFGRALHGANTRFSDYLKSTTTKEEEEMNNGIGPQDNAGGTHAGAPFAQKEATTNPSDASFQISYTGVSDLPITIPQNSATGRGQLNFAPTGGSGWNTTFLAPVSNALDVYNYYCLESVEFIWLTNAFNSSTSTTGLGHSIFKIIPWTAEYTIGGLFPGTDLSLLTGCDTFFVGIVTGEPEGYTPPFLSYQRTEHTIVKPMYQQNAEPTAPSPNIKAQYSRIPLQIGSANGVDTTVWYSLLYQLDFDRENPSGAFNIRAPYMYRVNISLHGRRFANISVLFRRQAYILGSNNMGRVSNRTECITATSSNAYIPGSDVFGDSPEPHKFNESVRDKKTQTLVAEVEEEPDASLLSSCYLAGALGQSPPMLQRQDAIRFCGDIPEVYKGKRSRLEGDWGVKRYEDYQEGERPKEKKIHRDHSIRD